MYLVFLLFGCFSALARAENLDRHAWVQRYLSVSYPLDSIRVTSYYGTRRDPFSGKDAPHSGLDLKADRSRVYAMFGGTVEKTGRDSRSGRYVIIRHGEYTVSYCHLGRVAVRRDMEVAAGDVIGISGSSGRATGPHLHITCRYKGGYTDPLRLLEYIRQVRLEALEGMGGGASHLEYFGPEDFIAFHLEAARLQQRQYGIPVSVTLSQMAVESAWGTSRLAHGSNNYFGIKCSREWLEEGRPYVLADDDAKDERFCSYADVGQSINHHSQLITSGRYAFLSGLARDDYHGWLTGLSQAGYATSKTYVRDCEAVIRKYRLDRYDK